MLAMKKTLAKYLGIHHDFPGIDGEVSVVEAPVELLSRDWLVVWIMVWCKVRMC